MHTQDELVELQKEYAERKAAREARIAALKAEADRVVPKDKQPSEACLDFHLGVCADWSQVVVILTKEVELGASELCMHTGTYARKPTFVVCETNMRYGSAFDRSGFITDGFLHVFDDGHISLS